ncbi:MAG: hypothetical protein RIR00_238 [Pseudomonadota bacterium]|jgi:hypothetical protein
MGKWLGIIGLLLVAYFGLASGGDIQVGSGENQVSIKGSDITTISIGSGNTSSVTVGGIEGDVQIQGITVINGRVYIDGKEVPAHVSRYTAKDGTVYRILRRNGGVEVTSEGGKP